MLLSNNSTNFTSHFVSSLVSTMGSHQSFAAPYSPSTNGTVERVNATLIQILRKIALKAPTQWDKYLPAALFAYRLSKH